MAQEVITWIEYAVIGFWFTQEFLPARYVAARRSGWALFLSMIAIGIIVHPCNIIMFNLYHLVAYWLRSKFADGHTSEFEIISNLSTFGHIMTSGAIATICNIFVSEKRAIVRAAKWYDDTLMLVVNESVHEHSLVEISLNSRKSYIGWVVSPVTTRNETTSVNIQVLLSGHRDEDTLELTITDDYIDVLGPGGNRDVFVTIPLSNVLTIKPFNLDLYRNFLLAHLRHLDGQTTSQFIRLSRDKVITRKRM